MPHVIVKLWPGKSEQQKNRLAEAIAKDVAKRKPGRAQPQDAKRKPGRAQPQDAKRKPGRAQPQEMTILHYGEESVSVAIEEVSSQDWAEKVYKPDIQQKWDTVYKKPGYSM